MLLFGQWRPPGAMGGRGDCLPPAELSAFACKRLRLYRPSGGYHDGINAVVDMKDGVLMSDNISNEDVL